ncbi:MAG: alpha/beta fold hydrolase [Acidimicrobiales bacterium]
MEATLWQRGRLELEGDVIYYEWSHRGDGDRRPVVVLTHGAGGSHAAWYAQVPTLAEHYRVLTWDSRGFGNSTCNAGTVDAAQSARDLDAILSAVAVDAPEPVHLVGQSMGGWWVVAFALATPGRVLSLTLSDTPGGVWTPALQEHFRTFRAGGGTLRSDVVGRHTALGETTQRTNPTMTFLYQQLGSFHEPPLGEIVKVLGRTSTPVADLKALGRPLLVIAGEEDQIFPPGLLAELAQQLGARFVQLDGAGHSPYFEDPEAYNAALLSFLENV